MSDPLTVVDASLVLKASLPNPDLALCQSVLARLNNSQLVVPALWVYEVTSALAKAVYFKQLTADESKAALQKALGLDLQIIAPDEAQSLLAIDWTCRLKRAAAYDSFYLALAETLEAPFWTADRRLINAFQDRKPAWLHWVGELG